MFIWYLFPGYIFIDHMNYLTKDNIMRQFMGHTFKNLVIYIS